MFLGIHIEEGGELSDDSASLLDDYDDSISPYHTAEDAPALQSTQLPNKRGLSQYFQGKSQSFTSFSDVRCVQDLAKRENPYNRKMKPCKNYEGLDVSKELASQPGPGSRTMSKASRCSSASLVACSRVLSGGSSLPIPLQKNST